MKRGLRRLAAGLFCTLLLAGIFPLQTLAVSTYATSAILMDVDSGRVLYAQNERARMLIASTTKLMTALVAIERGRLSDTATVRRSATLAEGSSMYLKEGERLTLETLLYGLLLTSGNDAALAVADAAAGGEAPFVALMNEKAAELGMEDTSFANPSGLDDEAHYSTALDMARLACAAVENETLVRMASTRRVTIGGRTMTNHNKLLSYVDGCIGLKTGYTRAAGRTLVSCAERDGQRLVAVTLQDGNDWADHEQLYAYGFSVYPAQIAVTRGEVLGYVPVSGGGRVPLTAACTFCWPTAAGETLQTALEAPQTLEEPVFAGLAVGQAVISLDGREVGRVELLCGEMPKPALRSPLQRFHDGQTAFFG